MLKGEGVKGRERCNSEGDGGINQGRGRKNRQACVIPSPHPSRSWGWRRWWDYTCSSVLFTSSLLHPLTPPPPTHTHPSRSWGWEGWWNYTCSFVLFPLPCFIPLHPPPQYHPHPSRSPPTFICIVEFNFQLWHYWDGKGGNPLQWSKNIDLEKL